MLAILAFVLSLVALATIAGLLVLLGRARRGRAELARHQHDTALALDRRCDALQRQVDELTQRRAISHLQELVAASERQQRLDASHARGLERYVLHLHDEARRTAEAG